MCGRKVEWKNDMNGGKYITLRASEGSSGIYTMFYDKWAASRKISVSKPQGTFVPRWEAVQDDPKLDLKRLLM